MHIPYHKKDKDTQTLLLLYSCSVKGSGKGLPSFFPLCLPCELKYQWTFSAIFSSSARTLLIERKPVNQKLKNNLYKSFLKFLKIDKNKICKMFHQTIMIFNILFCCLFRALVKSSNGKHYLVAGIKKKCKKCNTTYKVCLLYWKKKKKSYINVQHKA